MTQPNTIPSQSATKSASGGAWTGRQAYLLAAVCLLLGVALGYLFRGSASPAAAPAAKSEGSVDHPQQPDPNAQAVLAQAAVPLLEALNKDPNDYDSLVKLGNLYYDGQQFAGAIQYYERALALH